MRVILIPKFRAGDTNGPIGIIFYDGNDTQYGYVYGDGDGANFGLLNRDGQWALRTTNVQTSMYYDGSEKIRTTSSGISVTGNLSATGSVTGSNINTSIRYLGTGVSYNTDRTQKVSTGIAIYRAYNGGANSPWTYDTAVQFNTAGAGFEISADWISSSSTGLKVRSLRDCCQNWSSWTDIATSGRAFNNAVSITAPIFYDTNTAYYFNGDGTTRMQNVQIEGQLDIRGYIDADSNDPIEIYANLLMRDGQTLRFGNGSDFQRIYHG
jgi:hypothetical protein